VDTPTLSIERLGGLVLITATGAALVWANSPAAPSYEALREVEFGFAFEPHLFKSLKRWVNDGLMALFFLLVGLEIKREFVEGDLADLRHAGLTLAAAFGGMVLPVVIYLVLNAGGPGLRGWGIPMATDIAFAVGLMALLGGSAAGPLKLLLLAIAVIDDLGAVLVIALFYGHELHLTFVAAAAITFAAAVAYGRMKHSQPLVVAGLGLLLWYFTLRSGVHATIAGVLLAFTIPLRSRPSTHPNSVDFEDRLEPWVLLGVMPVFALVNAGVTFRADLAWLSPVVLGIGLGLVVGKPAGIVVASWLCVRAGLARLPEGVTWAALAAVGMLAGLGFTMSLFIAQLAFDEGATLAESKAGILIASTFAAIVGLSAIRVTRVRGRPPRED